MIKVVKVEYIIPLCESKEMQVELNLKVKEDSLWPFCFIPSPSV